MCGQWTNPANMINSQKRQIREIDTYLRKTNNGIPNGARVIVAGDWNCDLSYETNGSMIKPILTGFDSYPTSSNTYNDYTFFGDSERRYDATVYKGSIGESRIIDWVLPCIGLNNRYATDVSLSNVKFFPVRNTEHKHVDLSDHLAVTATFTYVTPPPTYKVEMNNCHSSIENQGTTDPITIEFWAGDAIIQTENKSNIPNCSDDLIFENNNKSKCYSY